MASVVVFDVINPVVALPETATAAVVSAVVLVEAMVNGTGTVVEVVTIVPVAVTNVTAVPPGCVDTVNVVVLGMVLT